MASNENQPFFLQEELYLLVTKSIHDEVLLNDLLKKVDNIGKGPVQFVKSTYESELLKIVKATIKSRMTELFIDKKEKFFTTYARNGIKLNVPEFADLTQKLIDNNIQLSDERLVNWESDFANFFYFLKSIFLPATDYENFLNLVIEWFEAGELSLEVWKTWVEWFHKWTETGNPKAIALMKKIQWPSSSQQDTVMHKFLTTLKSVNLDSFDKSGELKTFLELQLAELKIDAETYRYVDEDGNEFSKKTSTLNVFGGNIYLSVIKDRLETEMETMNQVDIIVSNTLYIDCDLINKNVWHGKNIAIIANKVNVCGNHAFDVSGTGFEKSSVIKQASNGENGNDKKHGSNGQDGRDGKAGESSGNITIVATSMSNPALLTLILVGGNGENGESGGNGGNGWSGKGVTKAELDKISIKKEDWNLEYFKNFHPPDWIKIMDEQVDDMYFHYQFKDDDGRELHFDAGTDTLDSNITILEFIILMKGTDGTRAGNGGLNGTGGEGGNQGECVVMNIENGYEYPVNKIQNSGANGKCGTVGKCGKSGENGNDIALIAFLLKNTLSDGADSAPIDQDIRYFGDDEKRRLTKTYYHRRQKFRLKNSWRKNLQPKKPCFEELNYGDISSYSVNETRPKKKERLSKAMMEMKQSIVLSKLMQKAQEYNHNFIYTVEASTYSMHAKRFKVLTNTNLIKQEEEEQEMTVMKMVDADERGNRPVEQTFQQLLSSRNTIRSCTLSPKQFMETLNERLTAENLVDFFSIEFDENSLLSCLNDFELKDLTESNHEKCNLKNTLTRLRSIAAKFLTQCHKAHFDASEDIKKDGKKLCHVKFVDPKEGNLWSHEVDRDQIKKLINIFYRDYNLYNAECDILEIIDDVFKELESRTREYFAEVNPRNAQGEWLDCEEFVKLKVVFLIAENTSWFTEIFKPLQKKRKFRERFGNVPEFYSESSKNVEAGKYVIRFYFQMKELLEFNRKLLIVTILSHSEILDDAFMKKINSCISWTTKRLIGMAKSEGIQFGSDDCEKDMAKKGFRSKAFRYIVSEMQNLYIQLYGNEHYGTVELVETMGNKSNTPVRLYFDGKCFYNIVNDLDLEKLLKARHSGSFEKTFNENYQRIETSPHNYSTISDAEKFAYYFPSEFAQKICEWIECYVAAIGDDMLLKLLYERFTVDGNHLEVTDFQFIITSVMFLQVEFDVSQEFIINFVSSVPQVRLVTELVLLIMENHSRKQLPNVDEILKVLNSIRYNRFAISIVIDAVLQGVDTDKIMKILNVIRNASLENTGMETWSLQQFLKAAKEQEQTKLSNDISNLESLRYYITLLRQQSNEYEAAALENLFTERGTVYNIPEMLIAQVCTLINSGGIYLDNDYLEHLQNLFQAVTKNSGKGKLEKHVLITDELQQAQVIDTVLNSVSYEQVFPTKQRRLKETVGKIRFVGKNNKEPDENDKYILEELSFTEYDSDEERLKCFYRDEEFLTGYYNEEQQEQEIIWYDSEDFLFEEEYDILADMVDLIYYNSDKVVKLLNEIDDCIFKLRNGIRLRDTQKIAIIYAVKCENNLLAQVNTGEGKTYIVAAIAIIYAKLKFYKFVDIITSSPVLAQRDANNLKDIYSAMGVTVDHNCYEDVETRKIAYKAHVVYGEISRFQRDYLFHYFYRKNIFGERNRDKSSVVVDEVDNMLLDNGNHILYLSHNVAGIDLLEPLFVYIERVIFLSTITGDNDMAFDTATIKANILADLMGRLSKDDISMLAGAESNITNVWTELVNAGVHDYDGYLLIDTDSDFENRKSEISDLLNKVTTKDHAEKIIVCLKAVINRPREIDVPQHFIPFCRKHLTEYIENAKLAFFINQNEAYVVDTDRTRTNSDLTPKVVLIDQNTGVDLPHSQWSGGLHQFIQIRHGCRVNPISLKAVFVSNVAYLKGYKRINGLSGTLGSLKESLVLKHLYRAELIKIPTFKARRFYEYIPIIKNTEADWLDALFGQINRQIKANKSVLVICHSISKVLKIKKELQLRFDALKDAAKKASLVCYSDDNMIVYTREHDDFMFNGNHQMQPGKLVLATNLAGRGTDIKLSDALKKAGGLHVIISFLPENCRIEDQAYGRAARCGDPGSGQVIVLCNDNENLTAFDLRVVRDRNEEQRLRLLKMHYENRIKLEEHMLLVFQTERLAAVLKQMNSDKKDDNDVSSDAEIIHSALLDGWALQFGSKVDGMRSFPDMREFIYAHLIEPTEKALEWIDTPQPLLALAVCRINENKLAEASILLNKVIQKYPEFAGDACYYLGIITQKQVRRVKTPTDENREQFIKIVRESGAIEVSEDVADLDPDVLNAVAHKLPDIICEIDDDKRIETEDYFLLAIHGFNRRMEQKNEQCTIISRLQQTMGSRMAKSDGFQRQTEDVTNVYDALCASVYDMIGHPLSFATFSNGSTDIEEQFKGQEMFLKCLREGYITEKTVNHNIMDFQYEPLKEKYMLSKTKLQTLFNDMIYDEDRIEIHGRTYFQERMIREQCHLPNREEFWEQLKLLSCFSEHQEYYILNTDGVSGTIDELCELNPTDPPNPSPLRIQLSDFDLSKKKLYNAKEIEKAFEDYNTKLEWLIEMKYLIKDASAIVNRDVFDVTDFFSTFDYFTDNDLAEWLDVSKENAKWIVDNLLQGKTFRKKILKQTRYVYQAVDDFDCSALPECLHSTVKTFLYNKFSYTFAYTALRRSLDMAEVDPGTKKPILLAWKPHNALIEDLVKYGFVHGHKFELRDKIFMEKEVLKRIEDIERKNKPRLFIQPATLMPTKKYFKEKNVHAAVDVQNHAAHHICQVGICEDKDIMIFTNTNFISSSPWLALMTVATFILSDKTDFVTSLLVVSIFGSVLYFMQFVKAKHLTLTSEEKVRTRYSRVLNVYSANVQFNEKNVKEGELTKHFSKFIIAKLRGSFKSAFSESSLQSTKEALLNQLPSSNLDYQSFQNNVHLLLDQPHNWRMYQEVVRDILTQSKPALCTKYYDVLNNNKVVNGFNDDEVLNALKNLQDFRVNIKKTDKTLLNELLRKIIKDAIAILKNPEVNFIKVAEDPIFDDTSSVNSDCTDVDFNSDSDEQDNIAAAYVTADMAFKYAMRSQVKNMFEIELSESVSKPLLPIFNKYIHSVNENSKKPSAVSIKWFQKEADEKYLLKSRTKVMELILQKNFFLYSGMKTTLNRRYQQEPKRKLLEVLIRFGYRQNFLFKKNHDGETRNQLSIGAFTDAEDQDIWGPSIS